MTREEVIKKIKDHIDKLDESGLAFVYNRTLADKKTIGYNKETKEYELHGW